MKTQQLAEFKALLNELEKENEELALALHDDILQQLLAVKLHYGMINGNIEHLVPKEIQIAFDKQNNELSEVLDLMKYLYYSLHPASLKLFGLSKAIKQAVFDLNAFYDSTVHICFDTSANEPPLDKQTRLHIYRTIVASLKIVLTKNEHLDFDLNLEYLPNEIVACIVATASRNTLLEKISPTMPCDTSVQSVLARLHVLNATIDKRTDWSSYVKISFPIQNQI